MGLVKQRLSAGGIVLHENKILLVHHQVAGEYDFWVMPGGGVKGNEGILRAAEREVWEETNLKVQAERIAYIEELMDGDTYVCKHWVVCRRVGGSLHTGNRDAEEEYLKGVGFFSEAEVQGMHVFPTILKGTFWKDLEAGFPGIRYLGYAGGNG